MSAYRTPGSRPVYDAATEPDPFRPITCHDCGRCTWSANGEDLCAACDLKWLKRGIDWASIMPKGGFFPGPHIPCALCGAVLPWPESFPNRHYAECFACTRERMTRPERLRTAIWIARLGQIAHEVMREAGILKP